MNSKCHNKKQQYYLYIIARHKCLLNLWMHAILSFEHLYWITSPLESLEQTHTIPYNSNK